MGSLGLSRFWVGPDFRFVSIWSNLGLVQFGVGPTWIDPIWVGRTWVGLNLGLVPFGVSSILGWSNLNRSNLGWSDLELVRIMVDPIRVGLEWELGLVPKRVWASIEGT